MWLASLIAKRNEKEKKFLTEKKIYYGGIMGKQWSSIGL